MPRTRPRGRSSGKAGTKSSITARYGEVYLLGPSPGRLIVEAHWHFDDEGKLADIALDYYSGGIIALGFQKENERPISLSGR